jgi:N-hydroxyarylamine O-acetyltransferase
MPDLDALLRRVGLRAAPPASRAGLHAVHRAFVSRVPYEALAIQLGEAGPLEVEPVAARLLHGGRGGYCFELNAVLGWMLDRLGFDVRRHEAVVGLDRRDEPAPTNHLALVVHLDGERWLADAGLGEGPLDPLPLVPGVHRIPSTSPLEWTVQAEPGGGWWLRQHPYGSIAGFRMAAPDVDLAAFEPHHHRLSATPESSFVRTLIVQRPYEDRIVSLRARTLSVDGPGRRERRLLRDAGELGDVLERDFAIDPRALGPGRLERLWAQARDQHEQWSAARQEASSS